MASIMPRGIAEVAPDYHGAINVQELEQWGFTAEEMLDFSVNSNPFGATPAVRAALAAVPPEPYPDRDCWALRRALGEHLHVPPAQIVVGNGAAELLWLTAFAFLQAGDSVLVVAPTFGEYARNARLMGACVTEWRATAEDNFTVHSAAIAAQLAILQPRLVHLCNPNNPTGQVVPVADIQAWATAFPDTLFVIDEAYFAFVPDFNSALTLKLPNVLVIRSMTKEYALAGVRLGYAVGAAPLIHALTQVRIPWSVSAYAQAAGGAAINDHATYTYVWDALRAESLTFRTALVQRGYQLYPSQTHYFLMDVANGTAWRNAVLPQRILVRLCESFHLPHCVRVATRTPQDNQIFLNVIQSLPTQGKL
jgi:histidinol-phosphate aminotransferase